VQVKDLLTVFSQGRHVVDSEEAERFAATALRFVEVTQRRAHVSFVACSADESFSARITELGRDIISCKRQFRKTYAAEYRRCSHVGALKIVFRWLMLPIVKRVQQAFCLLTRSFTVLGRLRAVEVVGYLHHLFFSEQSHHLCSGSKTRIGCLSKLIRVAWTVRTCTQTLLVVLLLVWFLSTSVWFSITWFFSHTIVHHCYDFSRFYFTLL